jgi:hypothetical protein
MQMMGNLQVRMELVLVQVQVVGVVEAHHEIVLEGEFFAVEDLKACTPQV